jgi:putative ABC transport system permease protein
MFWHDVRLAVRLLLKDRWYTAVAVFALGLGIGVNSTIFTFVNAVLLRGLPYEDSHRIMYVNLTNTTAAGSQRLIGASYPDFEDLRRGTATFEDLAAVRIGTMNLSDSERPAERATGAWMSANAFGMIGQQPLIGRNFLPGEDAPGAQPVAIIGYGLWRDRYGSDPSILGRTIRVNEVPARIVGVMPQGMKFPATAEMWMPLVPDDAARRRSAQTLGLFGRLRPEVTREQAQAEFSALMDRLATAHPQTNKGVGAVVQPYNERFNGGPIKRTFLLLMAAVALVLLIACANVANLLLARSASRAREMAMRMSLGATRWHIVRQLLVESILLGCVAGAVGLALSYIGVRLFDDAVSSVQKPYWIHFTMDGTVFAFLAGICILTGVLFGLAPALHVSRTNVNDLLKEGGRGGGTGARARRFSGLIVVAEVAVTIVLLVAAGLMVRSYLKLQTMELGFDSRNLFAGVIMLAEPRWKAPETRVRFEEALLERVRHVPGVSAATVASSLPLADSTRTRVEIEGTPATELALAPQVFTVSVADDYFSTLGVALRRGRAFTPADGGRGAEAAVVNERFAAQFFDGQDAVGRRFRVLTEERNTPWLTIVGVSPSIREDDPQPVQPEPVIYQPFRQDPSTRIVLIARSRLASAGVADGLRAAAREVHADQPLYNLKTFEEQLGEVSWLWRVFGSLFGVFALIALLLSAVGLYAVTAYSVAQRTQEIGVRIALGARHAQVSWLILRAGLAQLGLGVVLGLIGAWFASGIMETLLVQMPARDPLTFVAITGLLLLITVAACLVPARRAMRVDPSVALRAE